MPQDVFISYSSKDSHAAEAVCQAVESAGVGCWIAPRNIVPGQEWSEEIINGLNLCRAIVLIFSSHSNDSPQVLREVERAVNKRIPILVFRIEDTPLSKAMEYFLSLPHWFDAHTPPLEAHLRALTQAISQLLGEAATAAAPVAVSSAPSHNLPSQVTSFVGREKECAAIRELFKTTRLLTLTGSGGCGKTRLSVQVASELLDQFSEGAWFVELAPLSDPALVPQAIAEVLGIPEKVGEPLTKTLVAKLKDQELLLILDNSEHLLEAVASLVNALIRSSPQLRILVSSRESLGIQGEKTFPVPSLSLPERGKSYTPESLVEFESVRLFVERATLVKSDFALTDATLTACAQVCHRLDGIPLAIELAAARIRSMPLEQLASRLDDRFRILTGGSRTALPRQQTLRALIDWSYDLLEENQKALLCRLCVFAGGWTLEAAEQVCAGDPIEDWELLDLLTALNDKSLILYEERNDQGRYRLLETVRQYATDRLTEQGTREEFRSRHRDYFLALTEEAEPHLTGAESKRWLRRLAQEDDNLRAALEWSHASPDGAEAGLIFCGLLSRFWHTYGLWSEGRRYIDRALERRGESAWSNSRARAFLSGGFLMASQGDTLAALYYMQQGLKIFRHRDDHPGLALVLGYLGVIAISRSDLPLATTYLEESLAMYRLTNDTGGVAASLLNLGELSRRAGDLDEAQRRFEASLASWKELQNEHAIAVIHNNLARIARAQGRFEDACRFAHEALRARVALQDVQAIILSIEVIAGIALAEEHFEDAACLLGASEALSRISELTLTGTDAEEHECHLTRVREALSEETFLQAQQRGYRMNQEQAAAYALGLA